MKLTGMRDPNQKVTVRKDGSVSVETVNDGKPANPNAAVQQQYKDECDINNIMAKYATTGQFTHLTSKQGSYADFSEITSYQDMLDTVRYAQDAFASLPAEVRKRFGNDPGQLLDFVQDSNNYDEGVKLGLVQPKTPTPNPNEQTQTNEPKPKTKTPTPTPDPS